MFRTVTSIVISLLVHAIVLANLGFHQPDTVRPETIMVKLVSPIILPQPEPLIDEIITEDEIIIPDVPEYLPEQEFPIREPEIIEDAPPETPMELPGVENGAADTVGDTDGTVGDVENVGEENSGDGDGAENNIDDTPVENNDNGTTDEPEHPGIDLDAIRSEYSHQCFNAINAHKRYPAVARRLGQEGDVGVRFSVDTGGNVSGVVISSSSGVSSLDEAARNAVMSSSPLPPIPDDLKVESVTLTLTIIFTLD